MSFLPPDQPPPVLLDTGPATVRSVESGRGVAVPFGGVTYRDTIFETQLRMRAGDSADRYGVFVRRAASGRFVSCCISPDGVLAIRHFDGSSADEVATGDLARGMSFAPGLDAPNLFHVVACGPQLTFVLNGMVLMGLTVQAGLAEGELGIMVEHGGSSVEAVASSDWAQVRAVLPPLRRADQSSA